MLLNSLNGILGKEHFQSFSSKKPLHLSRKGIVELLPLFKEDCVFMREAYLHDNTLICFFDTFDYPFTKKPTKHFTRTHALLFVTQASYLIGTILSEKNQKWPLDRNVAIELAKNEQMTFTNIELNFFKFILNKDEIELRLSIPSFRIIKNRLYVNIEFSFPEGCIGTCKAIIALDGTMVIER